MNSELHTTKQIMHGSQSQPNLNYLKQQRYTDQVTNVIPIIPQSKIQHQQSDMIIKRTNIDHSLSNNMIKQRSMEGQNILNTDRMQNRKKVVNISELLEYTDPKVLAKENEGIPQPHPHRYAIPQINSNSKNYANMESKMNSFKEHNVTEGKYNNLDRVEKMMEPKNLTYKKLKDPNSKFKL